MDGELDPRVALAAQSQGFAPEDVIASAITETDVVIVVRQGHKRRVPLVDLPAVSAETPVPPAETEPEPVAPPAEPETEIVVSEPAAEAPKTQRKRSH